MPRGKGDKSTTKTVVSGPSDNGGAELESIMTPAGSSFDDDSPPSESQGTVDSLLSPPDEALAEALAEEEPERGVTTDDVLESIVRSQRASKLRLGDILKDMGLVTDEQIGSALSRQKETRKRLGQLLIDDGVLTELDLAKALASKFGVSFLDLSDTHLEPAASGYIDEKLARRYGAAPIRFLDDNTLLVAMVDPQNLLALQDLEIITGFAIQPAIASEEDIYGAIATIYRDRPDIDESAVADAAFEETTGELADIREATDGAPIIKLVNSVIAQSVDDAASDIHFEPQAKELMIRFRIDGVLHEIMSIPRRMQAGVISRLKIMAELDIAERRVPQDGRIGLMVGGKPIDMRVATLPTVYGEKIVMRLLDKSNVMLDLEDLGFAEKALKRFQKSFTKPYGAILVTGPTGSGKSTTLYAAQHPQLAGEERDHRGGPGRVSADRHQPGAGQRARRDDVRRGPALDPALRPRHRDGR